MEKLGFKIPKALLEAMWLATHSVVSLLLFNTAFPQRTGLPGPM